MTDDEKRVYLRNMIALARADEVVVLEESSFLVKAAKRLGVDRNIAASLLGEDAPRDQIDLAPIGRYSDRVRCLEDMVELALIDGDVALNEKKFLFVAAQEVGIDRDSVARIISEAKARIQAT